MPDTLLPIPEAWAELATELRVFHRELPRLLAEGHADKYVVVKGDVVFDVWDTYRDARKFGYRQFADGRFLTQKIDPRMLAALIPYFGQPPTAVVTDDDSEAA